MIEPKKSMEEILEQITCAKLLEDQEFQQSAQEKRAVLHVKTKTEITDKIKQLSDEFRQMISNDINLPMSIELAVATQMLAMIEKNPTQPINLITVSNQAVLEILKIPYTNINNDRDPKTDELNHNNTEGIVLEQIPEEIKKGVEEAFAVASRNAHREGATKEEQSMMVGFMFATTLDVYIESGISFKMLQDNDKAEAIKIIHDFRRNGNEKQASYYLQTLGITDDDMNNPDYANFMHEMDTVDEQQDEETKKINDIAGRISTILKYGKKMKPNVQKAQLVKLKSELDASEYSVDAIFKGLDDTCGFEINNNLFEELVKLGISRFNNPNVVKNNDGWLLKYMISVVYQAKQIGKEECAQSLLDTINLGLGDSSQKLELKEITREFEQKFEKYISENNGNSKIALASDALRNFMEEKGKDINSENEKETISPLSRTDYIPITDFNQKKANLVKMFNSKGEVQGLTRIQNNINVMLTQIKDKELIVGAALEYLEAQKDSNEQFMDEDAKEGRINLFKSIVTLGMNAPEVFERMQKLDRETAKIVVTDLISKVNLNEITSSNVIGAIQLLGKNLNEEEKGEVGEKNAKNLTETDDGWTR